jgi:hypothetical protein
MDCDLLPVNHAKFREVRESREFEFCRDQSWVCRKELPGRGLYWRHDRLHALSAYARAIAELKQSVSDRTSAGAAIVPDLAIGRTIRLVASKGEAFAASPLMRFAMDSRSCGWTPSKYSSTVGGQRAGSRPCIRNSQETSSRIRQDRRPSYPCGQAAAPRRDKTRFFAAPACVGRAVLPLACDPQYRYSIRIT